MDGDRRDDCAVRARHWDLACRWLQSAAEDSAQRLGDGANLLRWIAAIPSEVLDRHPLIRLSHVFSMSFSLAFRQNAEDFERERRGWSCSRSSCRKIRPRTARS